MKYSILFSLLVLCFSGCSSNSASKDDATGEHPRTAVTLTHGTYGVIEQTITLSATTVYRNKSVIAAPVSGFIAEMFVQCGTRVHAGKTLCNLESKEQHALGEKGHNGVIPIKATQDGIVVDVLQQAGNYVAEGTLLCTIVESQSLVFEINVPYEQRKLVRAGDKCTLELPDGTRLPGTVQLPLATMNTVSQSERVTASVSSSLFLPEGLNAKALFPVSQSTEGKSMILPKSAVQSNETFTEHWVMKLVDDSLAIKVPVEVTGSNVAEVAVCSDALSPQDDIILTGGYGLEDGANVVVSK